MLESNIKGCITFILAGFLLMIIMIVPVGSQQLQRFDLELDAIFISVFNSQTTWNLIEHAHLYTQNMEAEKEKVLVALES